METFSIKYIEPRDFVKILKEEPSQFLILDIRNNRDQLLDQIHTALLLSLDQRLKNVKTLSSIEEHLIGRNHHLFRFRDILKIIIYTEGTDNPQFIDFLHLLYEDLKEPKDFHVLKGGFNHFKKLYPRLCTSNNKEFNKEQKSKNLFITIKEKISSKPSMSEIMPFLFLGNATDSKNKTLLSDVGITHILNTASGSCGDHYTQNFKYCSIPIVDTTKEDISKYFDQAINFIDESLKDPKSKIFIHCFMGQSRSATIVLAFLIKSKKMTLKESFSFVKEKRNVIGPNPGFISSLIRLEKDLYGFSSSTILEYCFRKELDMLIKMLEDQPNNKIKEI